MWSFFFALHATLICTSLYSPRTTKISPANKFKPLCKCTGRERQSVSSLKDNLYDELCAAALAYYNQER